MTTKIKQKRNRDKKSVRGNGMVEKKQKSIRSNGTAAKKKENRSTKPTLA